MVASALVLLYLRLLLVSIVAPVAADTIEVDWSDDKYGPDGPWQAVKVAFGANYSNADRRSDDQGDQTLVVYPGGTYDSMTFTSSSCRGYSSNCGRGGFWDPTVLQIYDQFISWPASWVDKSSGYAVDTAQRLISGMRIQQFVAYNTTLSSADVGNVTYQNGKVGGVPLGRLSLGADKTAQEFTTGASKDSQINGYTFAGKMFEQGNISSYSYGLHVGSAAFGYRGSLIFGGYDKGRVIGPVYPFTNQSAVPLLDITMGVATGPSPSGFTSQDKLLADSLSVNLDPCAPYLSLPRATCDKLASLLPVTFDKDLKYYLWNTSDPNYVKVVSSPAYLGFSFPESGGQPVTIKVPFALLNLTLEAPITDTPKQYFPCVPTESEPKLGRAFLQAAFVGRNWRSKTSWLAQAPGPGSGKRGLAEGQIEVIPDQSTMITGYPNADNRDLFVDSWRSHWSIAESQGNGGNDNKTSGDAGGSGTHGSDAASSGLSTGAKAGIGIGAAVGVIALLVALFIWRKRSAKNKGLGSPTAAYAGNIDYESHHQKDKPVMDRYAHQGGNPGWNSGPTVELPHTEHNSPVELGDTNTRHPGY
jgi:hypothetical protein